MKNGKSRYAQAEERDDVARPSGKEEVFIARDKRTGALLGPAIAVSAFAARVKAADLYAVDFEHVQMSLRKVSAR